MSHRCIALTTPLSTNTQYLSLKSKENPERVWGDGFIAQLSKDLSKEFPEMKGWVEGNLRSIRNLYHAYSQYLVIRKQVVSEIDDDMQRKDNPNMYTGK